MSQAPPWLAEATTRLSADLPVWFTRFAPPADVGRRAAVLMLLGTGPDGSLDIVLTERSTSLRSHAGQVSFPGGRLELGEDAVGAALRETEEEVGIDPAAVDVCGTWPELFLTPSTTAVTPVVGWWRESRPVLGVDPGEVARAVRVPVAELVDPARRFTVTAPGGYHGPGFEAGGLFIWGFTAQLLTVLLEVCELAEPWDDGVRRRLPVRFLRSYVSRGGRRPASR